MWQNAFDNKAVSTFASIGSAFVNRRARTGNGSLAPVDGGTASRKADHIRINIEDDVASKGIDNGFDAYRFVHCALPEVDLDAIETSTELFGRRLAAPILISCMTGGTSEAREINRTLARVVQGAGLAMGLGSGRVLLEHPELLDTFNVRPLAPDALLFANLGAVQLNRGCGVEECRRLVDMLSADALVLHLNALQEALQPDGDTCFDGLLGRIAEVCARLERPVIVKEVGWGIASDVVEQLFSAGVSAIDVAGAGGTSWSEVERHRIEAAWRNRVAASFAGWGISTAECLRDARRVAPDKHIFASGGIRDGIDIAKAIALGADLVGIAGPFLRAAAAGEQAAADLAREWIEVLRIAMFGVGAKTLAHLRATPRCRRRDDGDAALRSERLHYRTEGASKFHDITEDVAAAVKRSGVRNGLVHVYSTHTTAAIRINENEELLLGDFERFLERVAPAGNGAYEHDDIPRRVGVAPDEPVNGHSHCRHLLLSSSETLPVVEGVIALGRWQRIFLIELCSSRERDVVVQVIGA
ncbi:MAG: type 2 isopentenyl-diphosphate Delta-isomerase [Candidatus Eremiobacteraeota bacterium]|nr:type 2 isopentenyl-diphosphate Delta-isomerase [Candidatus Eremiobacteraeota bacterium]